LSGKIHNDRTFEGDDLRLTDPKFQDPRFFQYRAAVARLDDETLAARRDPRRDRPRSGGPRRHGGTDPRRAGGVSAQRFLM
jgi:hypothetical protein